MTNRPIQEMEKRSVRNLVYKLQLHWAELKTADEIQVIEARRPVIHIFHETPFCDLRRKLHHR